MTLEQITRIKYFSLGLFLGILICFVFSIFWWLLVAIVILLVILCVAKKSFAKRKPAGFFCFGIILGIFMRILVIGLLLFSIWKSNYALRLTRGIANRPISGFIFGHEIGYFEAAYRAHIKKCLKILNNGSCSQYRDPFDGKPFKYNRNGLPYSIGPDFEDDHGLIIYDPTNGLIGSKGDIVAKRGIHTLPPDEN